MQKYCRRCLLSEIDKEGYFKNLSEHIKSIDSYLKVNKEIYKIRLNQCKNCSNLIEGMCTICGCYVELRAVMKKNYCPDTPKKWDSFK